MRIRFKTLGVSVGVVALFLSGCGTNTSGSNSNTSNTKGPITWWVPSPDPTPGTLAGAAKAFTKQTGIVVNVESVPWSTYLTKITTAITSGQGPDVMEIGNTWAASLAESGGLVPWTSAMFQDIGGENKFLKTSMSVTGVPGQPPISVPFLGQTWLLEYNKQLFREANISSPPTTWSAFYADAKKLTNPAKGVWGVAAPIGAPTADGTWDWILFRQEGGNYYNSAGNPNLTSAADVQTLTTYIKWVYPDRIIDPALVSDSTGTQDTTEFERGQAAMLFTQDPQQAVTDPSKYGIGLIPLPSPIPPGGTSIMSHVAGENLAIFKNSKHMAADLEFVKFLTSPQEQETINKAMFELPVTTAGLNTPYFQTPAEKTFGEILDNHAAPAPTEPSSNDLGTGIGNATVSLFRDDISAQGITSQQVKSSLSSVQQTVIASGN
ncbi:sugar ABC transporter substrate-binding protein [Alicyclobacillus fastidiosus]|uniref:Sugar ABC transporter substrate-binding protein n=1 Tax=Alicyclobacillus fastidiosus TaxID=392011 RepID=A0ABY6ZH65_9BACL|nr:sugar ABC transporter substrate-binding protein [Alicyclobacillus fastidiosus]WAH41441.1 sugar ABC transporter substrate-binding protein [Alicyclobacillus fastidiosus]GMA63070.1 sugar ABC transporter substrate-binding protein [Alicyclobacillus fastidiosus]